MHTRLAHLLAVAALGVASQASAQTPDPGADASTAPDDRNRPHVFVTGLYARPDPDRDTKNYGSGVQAGVGFPLSATGHWWVEGRFDYTAFETGSGRGTDFYQTTVGADLQYAFGNREKLTPYVLAGAGYAYNDVVPDRDDAGSLELEAGAGVVGRVGGLRWLRARGDARAVYDFFQGDRLDLRVHAGLEIALGKTADRVVVREVPVPVEVPVERIVERRVVEPMLDSDGDGVPDKFDLCPNTLRGVKVDGRGCVATNQSVVVLRDVSFDFDSARLQLNGQRLLDDVVTFMTSQPDLRGEIVGYTDSIGSDAYNQRLSERRARAAMDYLVEKGIAASRLSAKGLGEANPVASNSTDRGRETNRRVELNIIAPPTADAPAKVTESVP